MAEEECAAGRIPRVGRRFFLVNPLDGTREFVRGGKDYTVNVGLVEDGAPVLGVVYAPALGRLFAGEAWRGAWLAEGAATPGEVGAWRPIRVRAPGKRLTVTASKSHGTRPWSATWRRILSIDMPILSIDMPILSIDILRPTFTKYYQKDRV